MIGTASFVPLLLPLYGHNVRTFNKMVVAGKGRVGPRGRSPSRFPVPVPSMLVPKYLVYFISWCWSGRMILVLVLTVLGFGGKGSKISDRPDSHVVALSDHVFRLARCSTSSGGSREPPPRPPLPPFLIGRAAVYPKPRNLGHSRPIRVLPCNQGTQRGGGWVVSVARGNPRATNPGWCM